MSLHRVSNAAGVLAYTASEPETFWMEALISGTLVKRGGWLCLSEPGGPGSEDAAVIEFPWGTVITADGTVRLLNGFEFAVGDYMVAGGGWISLGDDLELDDELPWWVPGIDPSHYCVMQTFDPPGSVDP